MKTRSNLKEAINGKTTLLVALFLLYILSGTLSSCASRHVKHYKGSSNINVGWR